MKSLPLWILGVVLGVVFVQIATQSPRDGAKAAGAPRLATPPGSFPCEVTLSNGDTFTLERRPERIVAANTGVVEFLADWVEPGRLAAVPAEIATYSMVGAREDWAAVPRFPSYSAEVLLALEPDLVLAHAWQSAQTAELLRENGVPVLVLEAPRDWQAILETLELLGALVGELDDARAEIAALEERRERLRERARPWRGQRALSYSNFGTGSLTAGRGTSFSVLTALAGLENAAATAGLEGHVELGHEKLLTLDPDVLVVAGPSEDGGFAPAEAALSGARELQGLRALREERIARMPPKLFATNSIALLDAAEALAAELERLTP